MGHIHLEQMEFHAYHGCYEEEQVIGNKFVVDLTIETDMELPASNDNIEDAINYQVVYKLVKEQMSINSHLIEHVGKRILDALFDNFSTIKNATVKVSKMNPPIGGKMKCVSVTLSG